MSAAEITHRGGEEMHDFRSLYDEALTAFINFQLHSNDMIRACAEDKYFLAIRTSFRLGEREYTKVNQICNDLSLWHASKVEAKKFSEWSQREHEENALVRSLLKMNSGQMSALQDIYLKWLTKSQIADTAES